MTYEMPPPLVDGWDLMRSVRAHSRPRTIELLQSLGVDPAGQAGYFLLEGEDLPMRYLGVQLLASDLRKRGDLITCAEVAQALFRAFEHDPAIVRGGQAERHMANNVLDLLVYALSHCGRFRELMLDYPRWLMMAEQTAIDPYFASRLRLALVESLIHAGEYERAVATLREARERGVESHQTIEVDRLGRKLQEFYGRVDERPAEPPSTPVRQQQMIDAVATVIADQPNDSPLPAGAQAIVHHGGRFAENFDLAVLLGAAKASGETLLDCLDQLITGLWSQRSPLPSLIQCMDLVSAVLTSDQGCDQAVLVKLKPALASLIAYARVLNVWDDCATAKWMMCIVLKRLKDLGASAAAHRELRLDIDERRVLIVDPLMRARLASYFKYLYRSNAETLSATGPAQAEEFFHVLESAKGKILAESAGARPAAGRPSRGELAAFEARPLADLREALASAGAPALYVNYLADDDCTYAVTVDADGTVAPLRISLRAADLTDAALELQHINDGDFARFRAPVNPRRTDESPYDTVIERLSPLVDCLDLDGIELLCLNLPYEVSTVPAHMLRWRGKALIESVGVVQAAGAELLTAGVRDGASRGPLNRASVFSVPLGGARGEREMRAFARVTEAITRHFSGADTPGSTDVNRELLLKTDLTHCLVHMSSHGQFVPAAPLKGSGIFVAEDGELPTTAEHARFIFNAEDAAKMRIAGSHVTLSACVCGRSAQIAPGEALGMLWALLRGRARSVMGACWNADREAACDLMARFYELWLGGEPKWRALQEAVCEMKADPARSHPYFWAPFVLYGYWN